MSRTTNYNLYLCDDDTKTFQEWREEINGESGSNMVLIDAALANKSDKGHTHQASEVGAEPFLITVTSVGVNTVTADKNMEEILNAYQSGRTLTATMGGKLYNLCFTSIGSSLIMFKFSGYVPDKNLEFITIQSLNGVFGVILNSDNPITRSGGIMIGNLTLSGDPTQPLHAATKQYVDNNSASLDYEWSEGTLPSSGDWLSVGYGKGKFVAMKSNGSDAAAYSDDGINWTPTVMPRSDGWQAYGYGNGRFVAVAANSAYAAYSDDGINWTETQMPTAASWQSVAYGNGMFMTVPFATNTGAYSKDGVSWQGINMPGTSYQWCSVAFGNGKFVAVAANTDKAAYTTGATSWSAAIMPSTAFWQAVAFGNGRFVATTNSSKYAYSTDGVNWTEAAMPSNADWEAVTFGNDRFVAMANESNKVAYSKDGINWTEEILPASRSWMEIVYGSGRFVAVARYADKTGVYTMPKSPLLSYIEEVDIKFSALPHSEVKTFTNVIVSRTDWRNSSVYAGYPYEGRIYCTGVDPSYIPEVNFDIAEATSGAFAPVAATGVNMVIIYSKEIQTGDITIPSIVCTKAVV